jgi:hypothetical protein
MKAGSMMPARLRGSRVKRAARIAAPADAPKQAALRRLQPGKGFIHPVMGSSILRNQ